jgi:hypothetical protein
MCTKQQQPSLSSEFSFLQTSFSYCQFILIAHDAEQNTQVPLHIQFYTYLSHSSVYVFKFVLSACTSNFAEAARTTQKVEQAWSKLYYEKNVNYKDKTLDRGLG